MAEEAREERWADFRRALRRHVEIPAFSGVGGCQFSRSELIATDNIHYNVFV
jgi:hypothetical protein